MKLTIITINYNNLEGLKKTAESVLNQTWRDFEWIIVDGGSSDGSAEYIEQLASKLSDRSFDVNHNSWVTERFSMLGFSADDLKTGKINPHFSHLDLCPGNTSTQTHHSLRWCSEPDKGVYNAMNKGITLARGEYLNFMNSGDRFHESTTLRQVFEGKEYDADVLYGQAKYIFPDRFEFRQYPTPMSLDFFLKGCTVNHQSSFIRRDLQLDNKYSEDYKICSDLRFFLSCKLEGKSFYPIDVVVADFAADGLSQQKKDIVWQENVRIYQEIFGSKFFPEEIQKLTKAYHYRRFNRRVIKLLSKILRFS